jgi:hypothetical protein
MRVDKIIIDQYGGLLVVKNRIKFEQFCPYKFYSDDQPLQPCDLSCPLFSPVRRHEGIYFIDLCKKTVWSDKIEIHVPGFELRDRWEEPDLDLNEND